MPPLNRASQPLPVLSPYQEHLQKYKDGCGSSMCDAANRKVFCRGNIPCDVLFVGEAPGEAENRLGQPFVGPAGQLLDDIIRRALNNKRLCTACGKVQYKSPEGITCSNGHSGLDGRTVRVAFTNVVCCIPREEDSQGRMGKATEPDVEQVEACVPRLQEMLSIAGPRLVVCVGTVARDWLKRGYKTPVKVDPSIMMTDIIHPAAIMRTSVAQQGFMVQRSAVIISSRVDDL